MLESNATSVVYATRLVMSLDGRERFFRRNYAEILSHPMAGHFHRKINFRRVLLHHMFHMSREIFQRHDRTARGMGFRTGLMKKLDVKAFCSHQRPYVAVHAIIGKGVRELGICFSVVSETMMEPARCLTSLSVRIAFISGSPALSVFLAPDTPEFLPGFKKVVDENSHGHGYSWPSESCQ